MKKINNGPKIRRDEDDDESASSSRQWKRTLRSTRRPSHVVVSLWIYRASETFEGIFLKIERFVPSRWWCSPID